MIAEISNVNQDSGLRDGDDFTGRARRVARRLGLKQDRADEALFAAHGGRAAADARLKTKLADPRADLLTLPPAEERLLLMQCLDIGWLASTRVEHVDPSIGRGLFAAADLRRGEVIGEYVGVLRRYRPEDALNRYLAVTPPYGPLTHFIIDGEREGNVTRFINHSRARANVSNQFVFHARRWHRVLRTDRSVAAGEQLLTDYGEDYWRDREAPADL